ncbi:MAG: glycosyltransferase family 2 protein [Myxococcota bacterium]|nr:glycosyltransferase family 2 protein [Myxococcota bacterium]
MFAVALFVCLAAAPVLACAAYLFALTILSWRTAPRTTPERGVGRGEPVRFDFVVPAHNEELCIGDTVRSLLAVDYPAECRRVLVVADNCTDSTAARAEEAGAIVLIRHDDALRGKGYALKLAFERVLANGVADMAVVVDADTVVSPNLLSAFAQRVAEGATALQAEYGVRNPNASWRTRLMVIALSTFHGVRSLGRERLRVSSGLRGNGMGLSCQVLRDVPHDAFSIVEDLEYGIRLARAGYVVRYVSEAWVRGEMVSSAKASRSQRQRWEGGRFKIFKLHAWPLLRDALRRRDAVLFDMALDVAVPPLTYVVCAAVAGSAVSMGLAAWSKGTYGWSVAPWALALALIVLYVLRGVMISEAGPRGLLDLMWAPVYMLWKLALSLSKAKPAKERADEWVRTARENEKQ